jgi:hypothetical protein
MPILSNGRANGKVRSYGKIDGSLDALEKRIGKLQSNGSGLEFFYKTGPCGYGTLNSRNNRARI